ncbi:10269_t:CDS:2, partial [Ambispora gerdemannii]
MTSKVTWDATREVTREVNTSSSSSHISEIAITTIKATIAIGEMLPFAAAACQIAKKIVEMVETAQRHKEVCKDLSERIKRTTKRIEANPPTKDSSIMIQVSYQSYKQILDEAAQYIRDLIKPGTFSQKTLRRIKSLVKSKDMLEYHADLIGRLDAAIQDLQLDLAFDTNKKVNELTVKMDQNLDISHENLDYARETSFEVKKMAAKMEVVSNFAQLAMLTKGADFKEESIYVDPSSVEEDDDDPVIRGKTKRIKKMLFNGKDEVAVRKVQPSDKHKALRQAMILNRLGACKNIESFKGLMKKSEEIYVVTEWTENYDLEKYLHSNVEISLKQKLKFAEGIAAALTYCHKADIFHHDVK